MSFNFGSNSTGGFKLGGSTTTSTSGGTGGFSFNTNTPLKTTGSTPAIASPLTTTQPAANASPFKLGGLGSTTSTTSTTSNALGGGLNSSLSGGISGGFSNSASTNPLGGGFKLGGTTGSATTNPLGGGLNTSLTSGTATSANPSTGTGLNTTATPGNTTNTQQTTSSTLTFKILEDYVNKWMNELDAQEKDFLNQATQFNALDKLMVENGEKIVDLGSEVDQLNNEQEQLDQELNFLYSQQNDLEASIKKLETSIEQMPAISQQHCDTSRIEMYKLLIEVDNQLRSQSGDLKDIIKRLNCTNINLNDPIMQINKILNAHMDSLNWIEENTSVIQNQVENVSKTMNERLRESENNAAKYAF